MLTEAGNATDPMTIRVLYGNAASAARAYGLVDLEQAAVPALQAAEEVRWQPFEFSITVPKRFFDLYLPGFRDATSWHQALAIWFNSGPPSGNLEANKSLARKTLGASVIRRLVTTVLFRDGDLPARTLNGDDELFNRELVQVETIGITAHGRCLAHALLQIPRRFGIPPKADLTEFLLTFGAARNLVNALATALHLYWVGEYAACSHVIVPKAEAAARTLLAHGYGEDGDSLEASLAIRASGLLILLASDRAHTRDTATVRHVLANPVSRSKRSLWRRLKASFLTALWAFRR